MRIEMLCTGNELLDGSVVDTNAAYFCERAFERGACVARKETLPDDLPVLVQAFREIGERADFVVVSGGLGPTTDDLTVEAAAQAAGVPLDTDEAILAELKRRFAERGFHYTPNNARQARVPRGGKAVANCHGTAPMIVLKVGKADCHLLPGVPSEFRALCEEQLLPRLDASLAAAGARSFFASRVLKVVGIGESHLDAQVASLHARHPDVYIGFRTHAPENHLKLLARGQSTDEAKARLAACEQDAKALIGQRLFGADREELAEVVVRALRAAKATVALAESCTGGLAASLLASAPGASEAMVFSAVAYQEEAKGLLLGIDPERVRAEGAVSASLTRALAEAARDKAGASFGVAITGWAGPGGGTPQDPVGTVYLCVTDGRTATEEKHRWQFDRNRVRNFAAYQALDLLRRRLAEVAR